MGDGPAGTCQLTFDVSWSAHRFTWGTDIFKVPVVFLPYCGYEIVIVVGYHLQDTLRACLYALATAIALISVNNDVVISRTIGVTIVCNVAWHYH